MFSICFECFSKIKYVESVFPEERKGLYKPRMCEHCVYGRAKQTPSHGLTIKCKFIGMFQIDRDGYGDERCRTLYRGYSKFKLEIFLEKNQQNPIIE